MIFRQWRDILEGRKTQTRRLVGEGDELRLDAVYTNRRLKWQTWRTYAVVPKRGEGAIWWQAVRDGYEIEQRGKGGFEHGDELEEFGLQQLRIRIIGIRRSRVQRITEEDAIAEGICETPGGWFTFRGAADAYLNPIAAYAALWDSIHTKPGTRWADDPRVWVLSFRVAGVPPLDVRYDDD